ncbi:MAG: hypothetical protein WA840_03715 [Caulobacteraceae bacterium]
MDALVTICAQQKRYKPSPDATPIALKTAPLSAVARQWRGIIRSRQTVAPAADLYAGRAFGLARDTAQRLGYRLYVISAGLGLVAGSTQSPAYGLTVTPNAPESIQAKVQGAFTSDRWFGEMLAGPRSAGWSEVLSEGHGLVLIALTRPYAEMVGPSLANLPKHHLGRVKLFGAGLDAVLPKALHASIAPYDDRLDTIFPGTRSDFAQRAMVHYAEHIAQGAAGSEADDLLNGILAQVDRPIRTVRQSATDSDLLALIKTRLTPKASASRLLRQLRDYDAIACEQGRFARLFRVAKAEADAL